MNGVRVGSRLEQLLDLRKRVDTELVMLGHRFSAVQVTEDDPADPKVLVPLSHVARTSIRVWSGGDPSRHGTLPRATVEAYTAAHRPWAAAS